MIEELTRIPPGLQGATWRAFTPDTALPDAVHIYLARQHAAPQYAIRQPNALLLGPCTPLVTAAPPQQMSLL